MDFRVKICGITNVEDALSAIDAGADAIGLNFYRHSPRYLRVEDAQHIAEAIGDNVRCAGVFVNSPANVVDAIAAQVPLHYVQLHGDESPGFLQEMSCKSDIIRARRFAAARLGPIRDDLLACKRSAARALILLIDASSPGLYGGTGQVADWHALDGFREWTGDTPLVLAGGLTPNNVTEAIRIVRPHAVDVASGVESSPGKKDSAKMRDFVAAARAAFSS